MKGSPLAMLLFCVGASFVTPSSFAYDSVMANVCVNCVCSNEIWRIEQCVTEGERKIALMEARCGDCVAAVSNSLVKVERD